MTFDFFETSYLAFGNKLNTAFNTIDNLVKEAQDNLQQVFINQSVMQQYVNRNYRVAKPSQAFNPCRSDELYDLLNDKDVYINTLKYSENRLNVNIFIFNKSNNKVTRLTDSTTLKEGYCFYTESVSNVAPDGNLEFVSAPELGTGKLLFQYRVDMDNNVCIVGSPTALGLIPNGIHQYTSLSKATGTLASSNSSYTATECMCVCVVGNTNDLLVKVNGATIMQGQGNSCVRHCILYLQKGDTVSGRYNNIFRIKYNQ